MTSVGATRKHAHRWLSDHWDPNLPGRDWLAMVIDAGWACPSWSEAWFGRGLTPAHSRAVVDEFVKAGAPGAGHDLANIYAGTVHAEGSDDTKARLLRGALASELSFCLLYSEPGAGSDLASVRTRAERDGDDWIVNGQKVWTSIGKAADYGLLLARTDWDVPKHQGLSYFVFPMQQPGVDVRPIKMVTGQSHFNEVFISDARTPAADMLGELNGGWRVMQTALMLERANMAGVAPLMFPRRKDRARPGTWDALAGATTDLVALARAYGKDRDPLIRQDLARVHTLKTLNRWNGLRAQAEAKRGAGSRAASLGKLAMSDILHSAAGLQAAIVGTEATLNEPDSTEGRRTELALLNAFVNSIGGGTDQIQRNIIGERVLGLPKELEVDRDVPFRDVRTS